jgi:hypothetical protein
MAFLKHIRAISVMRMALLLSALLLVSCESGDKAIPESTQEATSPTAASFQMALDSTGVTVNQGARKLVKVTLTRDPGFTDPVTVLASSDMPGVTGQGVSIAGSMTNGSVQILVTPNTKIGSTGTIVLTGTSGKFTASTVLGVTVSAPDISSQAKIRAARMAGNLDIGTALLYRAYALFGNPRLPATYLGPETAEEDNLLLPEIALAWANLTPELQAKLRPFTLRPSDPDSWYYAGDPTPAPPKATEGPKGIAPRFLGFTATSLDSCAAVTTAQWVSQRSTKYPVRIWVPCIGDPVHDSQSMQMLAETLAIANNVWQPLGQLMGDPSGNPILDADGPDNAIDIYIDRGPSIARFEGRKVKLPSTVAAPPSSLSGPGPKTASGYVIIPDWAFGKPDFPETVIHELFHVFQNSLNILVANPFDGDGSVPITTVGLKYHWFTEASAVWAEVHFGRKLEYGGNKFVHDEWFFRFQLSNTSLNDNFESEHDYSSYIYPFFLEQNAGGGEIIGHIWKGLRGVTSFAQADEVIDAAYPFKTHFREFALRNINEQLLPGDPVATRYIALDKTFPDWRPRHLAVDLDTQVTRQVSSVSVPPLTARYLVFKVAPSQLNQIIFHLDALISPDQLLGIDALVKIDGKWEPSPRKLDGKKELKFCRDLPDQNVEEVRFILSNGDHRSIDVDDIPPNGAVAVTTSSSACKGTWVGTSSVGLQDQGLTADVTWKFAPDASAPGREVYYPEGTVTYSESSPMCTIKISPSTHSIENDGRNTMYIFAETSGKKTVGGIGLATLWPITKTKICGNQTNVEQSFAGGVWFYPGSLPQAVTLSPDGDTISGSAGPPSWTSFSFKRQ